MITALDEELTPASETLKIGKATLHRSAYGVLSFTDHRGIERHIQDPVLADALWTTAKQGPGEPSVTNIKHGTETPRNLEYRGSFTFKLPM